MELAAEIRYHIVSHMIRVQNKSHDRYKYKINHVTKIHNKKPIKTVTWYNVTKSHDSDTTVQYKVGNTYVAHTSTFLQYNVMHFRYIFTIKTILRQYIHDTRKSFQDKIGFTRDNKSHDCNLKIDLTVLTTANLKIDLPVLTTNNLKINLPVFF